MRHTISHASLHTTQPRAAAVSAVSLLRCCQAAEQQAATEARCAQLVTAAQQATSLASAAAADALAGKEVQLSAAVQQLADVQLQHARELQDLRQQLEAAHAAARASSVAGEQQLLSATEQIRKQHDECECLQQQVDQLSQQAMAVSADASATEVSRHHKHKRMLGSRHADKRWPHAVGHHCCLLQARLRQLLQNSQLNEGMLQAELNCLRQRLQGSEQQQQELQAQLQGVRTAAQEQAAAAAAAHRAAMAQLQQDLSESAAQQVREQLCRVSGNGGVCAARQHLTGPLGSWCLQLQAALEQQAAELSVHAEARVAAAVGALNADAQQLQQQADKQARQLAAEHAAAIAELQQAHSEALDLLQRQHSEALEQAVAQHRQQLEQLQAAAQTAHAGHDAKLRCGPKLGLPAEHAFSIASNALMTLAQCVRAGRRWRPHLQQPSSKPQRPCSSRRSGTSRSWRALQQPWRPCGMSSSDRWLTQLPCLSSSWLRHSVLPLLSWRRQ